MNEQQISNIKCEPNLRNIFMCGEIYHKEDGCFQYVCSLCYTTLDEASQFELHVVVHLQTERAIQEPEIKLEEKESEDVSLAFIDLQPSTQEEEDIVGTPVHLQIDECTNWTESVKDELKTNNTNYLESTIPCDYCDLKFPCEGRKEIHSAQSHAQAETKPYSCELCTATFDSHGDYSKHEILHMNFEDPLTCPHCNQLQLDRLHLGLHLNQLLPLDPNANKSKITPVYTRKPKYVCERPYECPTCNKAFKYKKSSQKCQLSHIKHNVEKVPGTLECDTCGKIFDTLTKFKVHIETHRKKKGWTREHESMQCDICQHVYKGYSNFLRHIRTHFNTCKCHFCDKIFKCERQRTQHEHIHRNEQHLCILCGANFPVRPRLNKHIREKHGDPDIRYKCPLCPLEFTQKHNLKRHSKTHTATRSFECNECPKKFFNAKTLKQHAILHTGMKRFSCKYCGAGFSQSAGRRGHEKRVHESNVVK